MKKILLFISVVFLVILAACTTTEDVELDVICEKEMYVDEYMEISITSNVEVEVVNLTEDLITFETLTNDKIKVKGLKAGTAHLLFKASEDVTQDIYINIMDSLPPEPVIPTGIDLKIIEDGPYYVGVTYHLECSLTPVDSVKNIYFNYQRTNIDLNKDTLEVVFNKAGINTVTCYSYDNFDIEKTITIDVKYDPDIEQYYLLFLGNSLTVHDYSIPEIVQKMIKADGVPVSITVLKQGGGWIRDQQNDCLRLLNKNRYTHVILQEQSAGPITNYAKFEKAVMDIAPAVKENEAKLVLYQTWAYDTDYWNGMSRVDMTNKLKNAYNAAANKCGADVIRAGEAFLLYVEQYLNEPTLYKDINHPTIYGSYLSACVHYATITGRKASENSFVGIEIAPDMIKKLQNIADYIVFDKNK